MNGILLLEKKLLPEKKNICKDFQVHIFYFNEISKSFDKTKLMKV